MLCFSLPTDATLVFTTVQCTTSFTAASAHVFWNRVVNRWNGLPISINDVANPNAFATFVQSIDLTLILPDPIFNYFGVDV